MRVKLRYALPAVQMAVAVGLIWWSDQWFKAQMRLQDMPGPAPAFTLCISINAPIALPRALLFRHVSGLWDCAIVVLATGGLWYWVALNIESLRREGKVLMFRWLPLRLGGDLLLIAMGAFWGIAWLPEARRNLAPWPWSWMPAVLGSLLVWSLGLIFFFGRDFIQSIFRKKTTVSNAIQ
jgi:hypothetical protein